MNSLEKSTMSTSSWVFPTPKRCLSGATGFADSGDSARTGMEPAASGKGAGLTQPKLSKMLRGQFRGISQMKMMDCLRLGRYVRRLGRIGGACWRQSIRAPPARSI